MEPVVITDPTPVDLTHTNQVQLATLMAAHYSATRASVDDWLRRRDQYLMLYITGSAASFSLYLSESDGYLILNLIPALTLVCMCAYLSADLHVAYLCKWLKLEYTALLEKFVRTYGVISLAPWHWDNSASLADFYASGVGRLRYIFLGLTFLLANAAAPILVGTRSGKFPLTLFGICLGASLISWVALFAIYRKRKTMA